MDLAGLTSALPALTALSAGLPAGGLPAGTVPTGTALAPVTALLRQVAAVAPGTPLATALVSLADQIDAVGDGGVSPDLLSILASTLGSIANTPGVPTEVKTVLLTLATQLAPKPASTTTTTTNPVATTTIKPGVTVTTQASPAAAAAVGRARLGSLRVDRKTGKVRVVLSCPASGPACKSILVVYRRKAVQDASGLLVIPAGRSLTTKVKLNAASRRVLKRKTTRFTIAAILPGGKIITRTVTAKLPKAKRARRRARA